MKTYNVEIVESSRELTNKERIMFKQGAGAQSLDALTQDGPIEIHPELYALLAIHNEKARDDQDYQQIIVKDKEGNLYITGSRSFIDNFIEIAQEMEGDPEEWGVKVFRSPSKNYNGKEFITCSII